jgi:hypothetical protein
MDESTTTASALKRPNDSQEQDALQDSTSTTHSPTPESTSSENSSTPSMAKRARVDHDGTYENMPASQHNAEGTSTLDITMAQEQGKNASIPWFKKTWIVEFYTDRCGTISP